MAQRGRPGPPAELAELAHRALCRGDGHA
jgi:hypothetical protein